MYHLLLTQAEQVCLAQEQVIQPEAANIKEPQERKARQKRVLKTGEEKKSVRLQKFKWTEEAIQNLIDLRHEKVKNFKATGQELSLKNLWLDVPAKLGLVNKLTPDRACKKWNQLVNKYKDIQLKIESGKCSEEEKAWPFCAQIRDILEEQWTFSKQPEDSEFDLVQLAWEERSTKHAKRSRSDIWSHFVKLNNKFARCQMCQKIFSYRSTVSNLKKHLLVMHLASYANLPPPQETEIDCENLEDIVNENRNRKKAKKGSARYLRERRSAVWNYFSRLDACYAECNVCKDTFSYKSSISNLLRHRRNVHPHCKTNFVPLRTFKKQPSKLLGPVHPKAPEMRSSLSASLSQEATENDAAPYTDALRAVKEQGTPGVKPSYLWNFFTIIDRNFAECNMCRHKLVYRSGMSNLAKHQRLKHPLTQPTNTSQVPCEDDPSSLPEDHPTIQITDVQSAETEKDNNEPEDDGVEWRSRKYSYIWNFFRDLEGGKAECRVCLKVLSYRASASNLMKHRQLVHPDQPSYRIIEKGGEKMVEDRKSSRVKVDKRKQRKRSKVWQFFDYVDSTYGRCKMCHKKLSYAFTTTNLLHHKQRMHPDVPLDYFVAPEHVESDNKESSSSDDDDNFDGGPGFDPPDDDDSSDDNQDTNFNNDVYNPVEAPPRSPQPKVKRKKGEKWSSVWRLFERIDEKKARCRTCKNVYTHRSTNTNLTKHVRVKHPGVFKKFEDLRRDFEAGISKKFDVVFPPPVFPPSPPAVKEPPRIPTSIPRRPEIVITIGNNRQQSQAYNNDSPYTLPIIFIQEDHQSRTKAAPTSKMPLPPTSHDMATNTVYNPNMSENYGHVPATTYATFEHSGHAPIVSGHNATVIQNIGGSGVQYPSAIGCHSALNVSENMGQVTHVVPSVCENVGQVTHVVHENVGQVAHAVPSVRENLGQVAHVVPSMCENLGQMTHVVNSVCETMGQVVGGGGEGVVSNDRLLSMVKESNQLLKGMHSAIQRQSDVLCRLAESIDAMRARNREEMLTD